MSLVILIFISNYRSLTTKGYKNKYKNKYKNQLVFPNAYADGISGVGLHPIRVAI